LYLYFIVPCSLETKRIQKEGFLLFGVYTAYRQTTQTLKFMRKLHFVLKLPNRTMFVWFWQSKIWFSCHQFTFCL